MGEKTSRTPPQSRIEMSRHRLLGRPIAKGNDQLREGGPRLRGVGTAVSMTPICGSELRSTSVRTSRGMWKEWPNAGEAACAKAGHSAQAPSDTPPESTLRAAL